MSDEQLGALEVSNVNTEIKTKHLCHSNILLNVMVSRFNHCGFVSLISDFKSLKQIKTDFNTHHLLSQRSQIFKAENDLNKTVKSRYCYCFDQNFQM